MTPTDDDFPYPHLDPPELNDLDLEVMEWPKRQYGDNHAADPDNNWDNNFKEEE